MGRKLEKLAAPNIVMFGKIASVACSETPVMILESDTENGWSEISEVLSNTQPGRQGRQDAGGRPIEENARDLI